VSSCSGSWSLGERESTPGDEAEYQQAKIASANRQGRPTLLCHMFFMQFPATINHHANTAKDLERSFQLAINHKRRLSGPDTPEDDRLVLQFCLQALRPSESW